MVNPRHSSPATPRRRDFAASDGADRAVRPKTRLKVKPRRLRIWNQCKQLKRTDCALAHELIILDYLEGVKYYLAHFVIIFQLIWSRMNAAH